LATSIKDLGGAQAPLSEEDFYRDQVQFFSRSSVDGRAVQQRLSRARVTIVGARAIGSHALVSLADSGVGTLRVLDAAMVTARDLPGNALLNGEDVGRSRAEALSSHIGERNPYLKCHGHSVEISSVEEVAEHIRGTDCLLVCLDSPAPAILDAVNQAALQTNVRWIVGQVYVGAGLIGPTVIPHQSPCYTCYQVRRNANLENYEAVMRYESQLRQHPTTESGCIAPGPFAAFIGAFLALEAVRLLSGLAMAQTTGRILRLDFFTMDMTFYRILRLPNCPACGYGKRATAVAAQGSSR